MMNNEKIIEGLKETISYLRTRTSEVSERCIQYQQEAISKLENQVESSVKQEDCADIMNRINEVLEGTGYQATAFDNTGIWLCVIIEGGFVKGAYCDGQGKGY